MKYVITMSVVVLVVVGSILLIGRSVYTNLRDGSNYKNLGNLLSDCNKYGVVVAAGEDVLVVKDANNICRQYVGREINVAKGDTLIVK